MESDGENSEESASTPVEQQRSRLSGLVSGVSEKARAARDRAQQSEGLESAANRLRETTQAARESDRLAEIADKTTEAAGRLRDANPVEATTQAAASFARTTGITRGDSPAAPKATLWSIGFALIVAIGLTLTSWLAVDLETPAQALPDSTPDTLIAALDSGYSPHEMVGAGSLLVSLCAIAAGLIALSAWRRATIWLIPAAALVGLAAITGLVIILLLLGIDVALGLFLPAEWEPYDPDLAVGITAYLFTGLCTILAVAILWLRRRTRSLRVTQPPSSDLVGAMTAFKP